jgi:hypothetical protein
MFLPVVTDNSVLQGIAKPQSSSGSHERFRIFKSFLAILRKASIFLFWSSKVIT